MGVTLTAVTYEPLFKGKHTKGESWFCQWFDHADRHIVRRLGLVRELTEQDARDDAREAYESYRDAYLSKLEIKHSTPRHQLASIAEQATFPRAVIADFITRIGVKIVRAEGVEEGKGRPNSGLQLFADRSGISTREVNRLVDDNQRIEVGQNTADKICIEFGLLMSDFIEEAFDWSNREGRWADRPGAEDCWPIGYTQSDPEPANMLDF